MATIQQNEPEGRDKSARIVFRCSPEFKKDLFKTAIDHETSVDDFCYQLVQAGVRGKAVRKSA